MYTVEISPMNTRITAINTTLNTITINNAITATIAQDELAVICRTGDVFIPPPPDEGGMGSGVFQNAVYSGFQGVSQNNSFFGVGGPFNVVSESGNLVSFDIAVSAFTIQNWNGAGISTRDGDVARIENPRTGDQAIVAFRSYDAVSITSAGWDGNAWNWFDGNPQTVLRLTVIQDTWAVPAASDRYTVQGLSTCIDADGNTITRNAIITEVLRIGDGTVRINGFTNSIESSRNLTIEVGTSDNRLILGPNIISHTAGNMENITSLGVDASGALVLGETMGGSTSGGITTINTLTADGTLENLRINIITGGDNFDFPEGTTGAELIVKDYRTTFSNITLSPATGERIENQNVNETLVLDNMNVASLRFIYNSTYGWILI